MNVDSVNLFKGPSTQTYQPFEGLKKLLEQPTLAPTIILLVLLARAMPVMM